MKKIFVSRAGVDYTGEWDARTGKLEPVLVEYQYPSLGLDALQDADAIGFHRSEKTFEQMALEGHKTLERYFRQAKKR